MSDSHTPIYRWDVFVSYAHEDLPSCAQPLAENLVSLGLKVWFDTWVLRIGDSLRRRINDGLRESEYGVVVLSQHFFAKEWPQAELDGLTALGTAVLPVWHGVDVKRVKQFSPILADKVGISTSRGMEYVAREIYGRIRASENMRLEITKQAVLLRTSPGLLKVLKALPNMGGVYRHNLYAEVGLPDYETRYCIGVLLDRGLIRKRVENNRDRFYLTDLGRQMLHEAG